jgi:glycosyltransferase involved in cell wall biosynthesis
VLDVLQVYYEPFRSGQTTHVLSLTRGLIDRGHRVSVVLPSRLENCLPDFEAAGAAVLPLDMSKVFWRVSSALRYLRLLCKERFHIVHIHSQEAGLVARPLSWLGGARTIFYTPQTIDIRQVGWRPLYTAIERSLASFSAQLISVNEPDSRRLVAWGIPPAKVVTIPNGIDHSRYNEVPDVLIIKQSLSIPPNAPVVMQLGRLSPQKNPLAFVEGASRVQRLVPGVHFVMIGNGPLKEAVETRIIELQLQECFHLTGHLNNAYWYLAAAHVVTLTSSWEGTPYSLLEAMAWSKPVVATAVNGCQDIVVSGKTGYLSPQGDLDSWAELVAHLLGSPAQSAEMGKQGRQHLEQAYTLDMMVDSIEHLYLNFQRESNSKSYN